ncbi:hypothetical protein [uncultured Cohaesibacter sp.]|uniref:hypothetical protein n=1 Tax=uncultured Cohaesibacter sp. TaxID=1002546 RepID=UPI002AA685F2|nr:hypothetical protein [uncultured Cohaesibacter sp.]
MTTIASELSVDARGPCALYIASDSRITWKKHEHRWDSGQKTFASSNSPDIFGYCGSAFFPTQILNQVTRQIDSGILFNSDASARERHGRWLTTVKQSLKNSHDALIEDFIILHGARDGHGMKCQFLLWKSTWSAEKGKWFDTEIDLNSEHSRFLTISGTGGKHLETRMKSSPPGKDAATSCHAFQTLFNSIDAGDDKLSGGAPQMVGIYREKPAQHFGVIWKDRRYFCGSELETMRALNGAMRNSNGPTEG